ncbi:hypothetical protein F2P45_10455 [Massilia sp. CCM 8733]|uniref:PrcB C-terminal domain-containing protein n=1 Tax=Massilia mucilaginosa TaxID=2609282 RepID=A0ABX0NRJ6_9BURK|nr:hypothetical protein [Massilia mucilaginosa]NHZ89432.1 hypothetical protein [Massilia mucilaginosa]
MTQANYLRFAVPLASAMLLAACGGGSDPAPAATPAPPPVEAPLPQPGNPAPLPPVMSQPVEIVISPPMPDIVISLPGEALKPERVVAGITVEPFVQRARQSACGQYANRLFVADKKYVFSAAEGDCASTTEQYVLYGATADVKLCSLTMDDMRSHIKRGCTDPALQPLVEKMVYMQRRGTVAYEGTLLEEIRFLPKEGSRLPFYSLAQNPNSGVQGARQQVIRDATTLASVWTGPVGMDSSPVNFETEMVIAVFGGGTSACGQFGIRAVRSAGAGLVVEYGQDTVPAGTACTLAINTPMQLVVVDRIDVPVTFTQVAPQAVAFRTLEQDDAQTYGNRQRLVIKDAQAWAALWKQHIQAAALPEIDFSKQMVVAAFAGGKPSGGYGLEIGGVDSVGGKLRVTVIESAPGRYSRGITTASLTNPVRFVVLARSDEPVEFVEQMSLYR